ncbi:MAG: hypothetical protein WD875_02950 [Pirellulales bacterium]
MNRLSQLRHEIEALRRKRQGIRSATAWSGVATALLWILATAFLIDFLVEGGTTFRAALLLAVVAAAVWAWQRWARPWLAERETDLDVALLVEGQLRVAQQPLGHDLVAGLQFDTPAAASWGSAALEQVVVEDVAEQSKQVDVTSGLRTEVLARRSGILFVTALVAVAAIALFPGHALAFANRLLLGRMHYPTATQIEKIVINGKEIPPAIGREPVSVACPQGQPLEIQVFAAGQLPGGGRMELKITNERSLTVNLPPVASAAELATRDWTAYLGRVDRFNDGATYQIYLGDAWTDPARIELVPMPVIDAQLVVTPPEYARAAQQGQRDIPPAGSRNLEVLEGSQVVVEVTCHNKPLASAAVSIDEKSYPLIRLDEEGRRWRLDPAGTPLDAVAAELAYKITAIDADGLTPERPVEGLLRIKADRPPRISAQAKTRHVLPTGRPMIEYRAADDYAVATIMAKATIVREGPGGEERIAREPLVVATGAPTLSDADGRPREFVAPLASLGLKKGDRLELIFEATDYRGTAVGGKTADGIAVAGKTATADPLIFNVTDVAGIESAVTEIDPVLEQQIQSLIQEHLGIGASE